MRKVIFVCDACGKQIDTEKGIWRVSIGAVQAEDDAVADTRGLNLTEKDFCHSCTEKAVKILLGKDAALPDPAGAQLSATPKALGQTAGAPRARPDTAAFCAAIGMKEPKKTAALPKRDAKGKFLSPDREEDMISPEAAVLLEQEIRFFLENGQKKEDIIPELTTSYRVSETLVREMIRQYEELSGKEEGKLMDEK